MSGDCTTCRFATWIRTAAGRLHPSGDGKCAWQVPAIRVPRAFYWISGTAMPRPAGGDINRRKPFADCPAHEGTFP